MDKSEMDRKRGEDIRAKLRSLLSQAMSRDREAAAERLEAILHKSRLSPSGAPDNDALEKLAERLEESVRERERRRESRPRISYPPELPITAAREEIVRAIRMKSVVIISGETGCGKSTQIPKMCLEAGRGIAGKIACTQPRRIAAVTIAHRLAEELGEPLGRSVGYKIRFQDRTSRESYIKIMTDGMLLSEARTDRGLHEYDTIIIDEAHERSLNIDFLLGITRTLLDSRPDLKLVITSATLDTEKFSAAFRNAPVIHVGGRLFPVDVEYHPPENESDGSDYVERAVAAVERIKRRKAPGDILVFMPTEQDILETCDRLEGRKYPGVTILPLFARLPGTQQGRVYSVQDPKIVVATNVAETSLTIPGIRYVVDTGLARISQYLPGTRINSLPISPVSRSSADQRKGRCGRVEAGICIRLYSREDYEARPLFTPPEILRSNLAEVILRMMDLGLGHPAEFPFVDKPLQKNIRDGFDTLLELGAIRGRGRDFGMTSLGRRMAAMPLDPRISRMLLEAGKEECLPEIAVIASVLSLRDPRERPPDAAAKADQAQAVFKHPDSDFLTLLNIWDRFQKARRELGSQNKLKQFCRDHFLSSSRMREWGFVLDQILGILEEQKILTGRRERREITESGYAGIHRAVLSGFLSNIAVHKEKFIYTAAKGREVMMFPGSSLFGKPRPWIVAAEMVQTSRLFARTAAKVDPAWLEALGGDLCRYSYAEPHWDKKRGEVRAKEKVTLFGLEIVSGRDVSYAPVAFEEARDIFIMEALVEGNVEIPPPFLKHNLDLVRRISETEEKLRRRDILTGEREMADFYAARIRDVADLRTLERKIRREGGDAFLRMTEKDLMRVRPEEEAVAAYPDVVDIEGRRFRAVYRFAPGEESDGVTLQVPASLIKDLPAEPLEWGVPGQFADKITALIKGLPKKSRKLLMPAAEKADIIVREMKPTDVSLFKTLSRFVRRRFQVDIPAAEWARAEIPLNLRMRVAVTDHEGRELGAARNLDILRKTSVKAISEDSPVWEKARERWERTGMTDWDLGPLPETVAAGPYTAAFPGLSTDDQGVALRLFKSREEALASHVKGIEALLLPHFAKDLEFVRRTMAPDKEYEAPALYFGGLAAVLKAMVECLKREVFRKNIRNREDFDRLAATAVRELFARGEEIKEIVRRILEAIRKARVSLPKQGVARISAVPDTKPLPAAVADAIRGELDRLAPKDLLERASLEKLRPLPRYLEALKIRTDRARYDPEKDRKKAEQVEPFALALRRLGKGIDKETSPEKKAAVEELSAMIEEFRVSLFAPELKTAYPISAKRLALKIKEIEGMV